MVIRSQPRLDALGEIIAAGDADAPLELICNSDPLVNDRLMEELADGSLVINATGMGKDTPGSPITDAGRFPRDGVAWELNYRGELDFLHQARAQEQERSLAVHDGWPYFIYGWTAVIEEVFDLQLTSEDFAALTEIADEVRAATTAGGSR